jgi:ArsR family transcriptional regulator, lead/cadmium/zinc/bismuth-responsive transcriptional repressor
MLNGDLTTAQKCFFTALSDENRLAILHVLRKNGPMYVNDICKALEKDQYTVSHHLACLRNCGLVNSEKKGKFVFYSLKDEVIMQIIDLSDIHVRNTIQGILSCAVVNEKRKK